MKRKKILSLTSFAAVSASIATLVSCGAPSTKFDQIDDNVLKIANTFSATSNQTEVLKEVIKKWNEKPEVKAKQEGYLPIELFAINGGYNGLTQDLGQKLKAKASSSLYNLAFNYPSVIGTLAKYNMQLDFNGANEKEKSIGISQWVKDTFSEKFIENNKQIAGIQKKGQEDSLWFIPSARSTQLLTINKPVLAYIVKMATADSLESSKKATIKESSKAWFDELAKVLETKDSQKSDEEVVKAIWKDYVALTKEEGGFGGYEFSVETFQTYNGLFDLTSRIKKSFPKSEEGDYNNRAENVFGVDSISSLLYLMAFSEVEGDYTKFLFGLNKDKTSVDYSEITKPNSPKYELFKSAFEKLSKLINEKSLFIKKNADYSSNRLKNHKLVFAVSSTAGYKHNFTKDDVVDYVFTLLGNDSTKIEGSISAKYSNYLYKPTADEISKGAIAKYKSTTAKEKDNYTYIYENEESEYAKDKKIKKLKVTPELKSAIEKLSKYSSGQADEKLALLSSDTGFSNLDSKILKVLVIPAGQIKGYNNYLVDIKFEKQDDKETGYRKYVVPKEYSLQENELGYVNVPFKANENKNKKVAIAQGPSLLGIHASEKENLATLNFVKWFSSQKEDWTITLKDENTSSNYKQVSALELFGIVSGYTITSKESLKGDVPSNYDNFNKKAFELFKAATEGANKDEYVIYEDPTDSRSSEFRDKIDASFSAYSNRVKPGKAETFEEYLKQLETALGVTFKR
ncbi:P80 family lipoprotein [Mesomycoplasma molare]|uniref:P80 family lipoprotein n=1 Tax=Mesomycoplasma molare TaxID=171288 RepID=A0ABY5TU37_9BACT|nr:P80 family lipoprotein [Mesomycoplasma molare]UWD34182.1 P80 family lipoprotein [Mesomycoplasma molare]